jgi:hypothetical protein
MQRRKAEVLGAGVHVIDQQSHADAAIGGFQNACCERKPRVHR